MFRNFNFYYLKRCANSFNQDQILKRTIGALFSTAASGSENETPKVSEEVAPKKEISKAMRSYLQRTKEHDEFMAQQNHEFQIGKRHLANMMGENPDTFTQEDIDNAIEYLFPSGLFEKRARPIMRPPEEIFPQRKAAEFDETGRPFHFLFYTGRANYYKLLYDVVEHMHDLNKFEDAMIRKNSRPDPNLAMDSSGYQWIEKVALEKKLVEMLTDRDYENFVTTMDSLISFPYSYRIKEFIEEYRKPLMKQTNMLEVPKPHYDTEGRAYVTTYECLRKRARGHVTVKAPGIGQVFINDQGITYFPDVQSREQVLFPLVFANMLDKVDVVAHVEGGGPSSQAGAVRWGIAMSLRSFVDQDTTERMRLAGLLTRDYRTKERKKPGQAGARKKFTWKKR